jgi:hypothetical protein
MSALPPKADIRERVLDVRFGPKADIEPDYSITASVCHRRFRVSNFAQSL